jgi:hypothetical protein
MDRRFKYLGGRFYAVNSLWADLPRALKRVTLGEARCGSSQHDYYSPTPSKEGPRPSWPLSSCDAVPDPPSQIMMPETFVFATIIYKH